MVARSLLLSYSQTLLLYPMSKCCVNSVTGYFLPLFAPPKCNSFHQNSFQDTIGVMSMRPVPYLSIEDYPEIERGLETRNEYLAGVMYAMFDCRPCPASGCYGFQLGWSTPWQGLRAIYCRSPAVRCRGPT